MKMSFTKILINQNQIDVTENRRCFSQTVIYRKTVQQELKKIVQVLALKFRKKIESMSITFRKSEIWPKI